MKLLTLIKKESVHINGKHKTIPAEEFSKLIEGQELLEQIAIEIEAYREEVAQECAALKEEAKEAGFEEGLEKWSAQLAFLEEEIKRVEEEMNKTIVPLALTAVKKIIGKELEERPETIIDIVRTALKPVSQHRKITVFLNKEDLDRVEEARSEIKALFEHLESLAFKVREDVKPGGCIIETEAGIINAQLDSQLKALEAAFRSFFENHKKKGHA